MGCFFETKINWVVLQNRYVFLGSCFGLSVCLQVTVKYRMRLLFEGKQKIGREWKSEIFKGKEGV